MCKRFASVIFAAILLAGIMLHIGCSTTQTKSGAASFRYDQAEFAGPKPWSSENFKNNPDNFQFVVLGDRGGGARPDGTYERAIEQINWLQPEFVMSVGDYIEGYKTVEAEMNEQWEEFEAIITELNSPFFYVRGNHDINMPLTRKAWS